VRKFKNGDSVEYTGETYYGLVYGMKGVVLGYPKKSTTNESISFNRKNRDVAVSFPSTVHATIDCDGMGEGLYVGELYLKKVKEA
jgi:hypothetical protein